MGRVFSIRPHRHSKTRTRKQARWCFPKCGGREVVSPPPPRLVWNSKWKRRDRHPRTASIWTQRQFSMEFLTQLLNSFEQIENNRLIQSFRWFKTVFTSFILLYTCVQGSVLVDSGLCKTPKFVSALIIIPGSEYLAYGLINFGIIKSILLEASLLHWG